MAAGLLMPALLAAGPRLDKWQVTGPGGGGAQFIPTVSPHDSSRVLVRCDMTGSYITHDAGLSWRMFNLRTVTNFFVFDPLDAKVIYAGGLGLWRSVNSGATWSLVYPHPDSVAGVRIAGDHGEESIVLNGPPSPGSMTALAVDPADSRVLYAGIAGSLYISTDWGATWTYSARPADGVRRIWADPASPSGDRKLYVAGANSVSIRQAGQWRVSRPPSGVTALADISLGFAAGGPPVLYAVADRILVSEDDGATWRDSALPGTNTRFAAIAAGLNRPDVVYVSYSNLTEPDGRYWFGVARSEDRGRNWQLAWKSANQSPPNVDDAWLPGVFGAGWAGPPMSMGVAPDDPDVCYGTDYGRTIRTLDGGKTWQAAYSRKTADGGFATRGLDVTTAYGVHQDPFQPDRLFISYTDIGLWRTENGGQSWLYSGTGIPSNWRNTAYWVEIDPAVPGRMWAAVSRTHDLPRPKMWRRTEVSTFQGGVVASDDGGRSWRKSGEGIPEAAVTHVLLDPDSPKEARVLYAAAFGRGVYKSSDGGATWALRNHGIEGDEPFAWRLARDRSGALYLVVARRSDDGTYGTRFDGALYRSIDSAQSWTRMSLPTGLNGPNGLAVDPADPRRLYLAAWGRYSRFTGDTDGGVFLSEDGGETWRNALSADQHIYDVTIDPRTGVLYAAGFESSAWRSADRGATWSRIRGYNFKWGHRVIPDPRDAEKIYVTTFGGSVWHGPALGDPGAREDIAGPEPLMFSAEPPREPEPDQGRNRRNGAGAGSAGPGSGAKR